MAHIVFDEVFKDGVRVSSVQRIVTDYEETQHNSGPQLRAAYDGLRQWKLDADTAVAAWDGRTVAQNMAVLKVVVQRFGVLADRTADLLVFLNADK